MKFITTLLIFLFNSEIRNQLYLFHRCKIVESEDLWRIEKLKIEVRRQELSDKLNNIQSIMQVILKLDLIERVNKLTTFTNQITK